MKSINGKFLRKPLLKGLRTHLDAYINVPFRMKVFQLVNNPYLLPNPFVATLMDGVKSISDEVEFGYGIDVFWSSDIFSFDVLHIHWPDAPISRLSPQTGILKYQLRLMDYKSRGGKIIVTCHNLEPHYCKKSYRIEVYNMVYGMADVIIHLGNYSQHFLEQKYPTAKHIICYHHTYDTLYTKLKREVCIKALRLDPKKKYILCFGDFRNSEERRIVDKVLRHCYGKGIEVLAPRYYGLSKRKNLIALGFQWFRLKYKVATTPGLHINGWFISDEELSYYYGASDISLIQRKKILNSGNLPMGFYFGKVVVGPNVGNVGDILKLTDNPTFCPDDEQSVIDAVEKALELQMFGKGLSNSQYAEMYFSTHIICKQMYEIYKSTINSNS